MNERYYSTGKAARILRIHNVTLFKWIKSGRVRAEKTPSNRWLVPQSEINRLLGVETESAIPGRRALLYARVSSRDQKSHLESQLKRLNQYVEDKRYEVTETYAEIASGLNENRRKLAQALNKLAKREADVLIVEFKDRLTRFGFNYISRLVESLGGRVEVVENDAKKNVMQELVEDMIRVVTSFCARLYGARSQKFRTVTEAVKGAVHA